MIDNIKQVILTDKAPPAAGPYSQAIKAGATVYLAGQIPLDPKSGQLVSGGFEAQVRQVINNLSAVAEAAGGSLSDMVRVSVYLIDLANFPIVNALMEEYFAEPYPARTTIQVSALPKNAAVEMDAIMVLAE